ncbi:MAG: aromatic-L-amino-acid decarboxylase [Gemmatimonadetes bacterium]|nr:aromatic-L-amino-acid decarboxylase [Gemmatimonadota bacterium]
MTELTLDPTDWDSLRALGHQMVDDMLAMQRDITAAPAWRPIPVDVVRRIDEPVPLQPQGEARAYEDFQSLVQPYPSGNLHPRFWGRVMGTGSPFGALAEFLSASLNVNLASIECSALYIEEQVLRWSRELMGFPASGSGVLVSGCSIANFIGIAVAREAVAGDIHRVGVAKAPPLRLYCSDQAHMSVRRAVALLGLGTDAIHYVPSDANYRISVVELEQAIHRDRAAGYLPFCIVGNAGTVGTGAIDDLNALADVAQREGAWYHVDGAFGAILALSPTLKPQLAGIERADSLAFDYHKWMHVPYGAAAVLVRERAQHLAPFLTGASSYLGTTTRGAEADQHAFHELGPELSRDFRALKVWMALKAHGVALYGKLAEQNVEQAAYLATRAKAHPRLELMAPAPMNIVCLRYVHAGMSGDALDRVNEEILVRLQEQGIAVPTRHRIRGQFAIRVAITNHRTRREDLDALVEGIVEIGRQVVLGGAVEAVPA